MRKVIFCIKVSLLENQQVHIAQEQESVTELLGRENVLLHGVWYYNGFYLLVIIRTSFTEALRFPERALMCRSCNQQSQNNPYNVKEYG